MWFELSIISLAALGASALTFFSGFGLGTLLMPVFLIFFPVNVAIALTAIVHLLNNIFKLSLLYRLADWKTVLSFGIPAFIASFLGATLLLQIDKIDSLLTYQILDHSFDITLLKLIIALVILAFIYVEISPKFKNINLSTKYLPIGGILSGFFGGLSGHQGALRSMFLIKCGLDKNAFIATGVVIATIVDFSRLFVYKSYISQSNIGEYYTHVVVAVVSAFVGVFVGRKMLTKITMQTVQRIVAIMLAVIAILLATGII